MIKRVRTRDNRHVAFDRTRIEEALLEAMSSAGTGDRELAVELTDAVAHFLEQYHGADPVLDVDRIHDMVEKLLMETGHREIARQYILLREKRARQRERIRVSGAPAPRLSDAHDVTVEGRHGGRGAPWDRARISRALIEEADVDAEAAETVAEAVEAKVFRSGRSTLSTSLVRELVDIELFERGYTTSLRRQSSLALPKYDVEQLLYRGGDRVRGFYPGDPLHVSRLLGELMLRQYVLDEVFSDEVREAHRSGAIHLHQLDRPLQWLRAELPAGPIDGAEDVAHDPDSVGDAGRYFRRVFGDARELMGSVAEEIDLHGLAAGLHYERQRRLRRLRDLPSFANDPALCASELVRAADEYRRLRESGSGSFPELVLRVPFEPRLVASEGNDLFGATTLREDSSLFLLEALKLALADREGREVLGACPLRLEVSEHTFADRRYLAALRSVLSLVPEEASVVFSLDPRPHHSVGGKVTLNLPRMALEARAAGEKDIAPRLRAAARLALEATRRRASFLGRVAVHPDGPFATLYRVLREAGSRAKNLEYAVGVLGLDDAVRIHHGQAMHESPEAHAHGVEWIETLAQTLESERRHEGDPHEGDPMVFLEETANRGPLRRLQKLDEEAFGAPSSESSAYTSGVRTGRWAPVDPLTSWQWREALRPRVRLLDRLDEVQQLRAEGVEVLVAFLEEITERRQRMSPAALARGVGK